MSEIQPENERWLFAAMIQEAERLFSTDSIWDQVAGKSNVVQLSNIKDLAARGRKLLHAENVERAREYLITRASLDYDDLADAVVSAELDRLASIAAANVGYFPDGQPESVRASTLSAGLRVIRDNQRQLRRLKADSALVPPHELEALEELHAKSTPGPYLLCHDGECPCCIVWSQSMDVPVHYPPDAEQGDVPDLEHRQADARFIAVAHNLMPRLINTIRAYHAAFGSLDDDGG